MIDEKKYSFYDIFDIQTDKNTIVISFNSRIHEFKFDEQIAEKFLAFKIRPLKERKRWYRKDIAHPIFEFSALEYSYVLDARFGLYKIHKDGLIVKWWQYLQIEYFIRKNSSEIILEFSNLSRECISNVDADSILVWMCDLMRKNGYPEFYVHSDEKLSSRQRKIRLGTDTLEVFEFEQIFFNSQCKYDEKYLKLLNKNDSQKIMYLNLVADKSLEFVNHQLMIFFQFRWMDPSKIDLTSCMKNSIAMYTLLSRPIVWTIPQLYQIILYHVTCIPIVELCFILIQKELGDKSVLDLHLYKGFILIHLFFYFQKHQMLAKVLERNHSLLLKHVEIQKFAKRFENPELILKLGESLSDQMFFDELVYFNYEEYDYSHQESFSLDSMLERYYKADSQDTYMEYILTDVKYIKYLSFASLESIYKFFKLNGPEILLKHLEKEEKVVLKLLKQLMLHNLDLKPFYLKNILTNNLELLLGCYKSPELYPFLNILLVGNPIPSFPREFYKQIFQHHYWIDNEEIIKFMASTHHNQSEFVEIVHTGGFDDLSEPHPSILYGMLPKEIIYHLNTMKPDEFRAYYTKGHCSSHMVWEPSMYDEIIGNIASEVKQLTRLSTEVIVQRIFLKQFVLMKDLDTIMYPQELLNSLLELIVKEKNEERVDLMLKSILILVYTKNLVIQEPFRVSSSSTIHLFYYLLLVRKFNLSFIIETALGHLEAIPTIDNHKVEIPNEISSILALTDVDPYIVKISWEMIELLMKTDEKQVVNLSLLNIIPAFEKHFSTSVLNILLISLKNPSLMERFVHAGSLMTLVFKALYTEDSQLAMLFLIQLKQNHLLFEKLFQMIFPASIIDFDHNYETINCIWNDSTRKELCEYIDAHPFDIHIWIQDFAYHCIKEIKIETLYIQFLKSEDLTQFDSVKLIPAIINQLWIEPTEILYEKLIMCLKSDKKYPLLFKKDLTELAPYQLPLSFSLLLLVKQDLDPNLVISKLLEVEGHIDEKLFFYHLYRKHVVTVEEVKVFCLGLFASPTTFSHQRKKACFILAEFNLENVFPKGLCDVLTKSVIDFIELFQKDSRFPQLMWTEEDRVIFAQAVANQIQFPQKEWVINYNHQHLVNGVYIDEYLHTDSYPLPNEINVLESWIQKNRDDKDFWKFISVVLGGKNYHKDNTTKDILNVLAIPLGNIQDDDVSVYPDILNVVTHLSWEKGSDYLMSPDFFDLWNRLILNLGDSLDTIMNIIGSLSTRQKFHVSFFNCELADTMINFLSGTKSDSLKDKVIYVLRSIESDSQEYGRLKEKMSPELFGYWVGKELSVEFPNRTLLAPQMQQTIYSFMNLDLNKKTENEKEVERLFVI